MKRTFVESKVFQEFVDSIGNAEFVSEIQSLILGNPQDGKVVQGTGGIRKMRVSDEKRGKGKRGGYRVLYLDLPEREKTYLLYAYTKGEKEDITGDEKKVMKELVSRIKKEAK